MDLTIQQLRIVLAVADEGSFTAAGERLRLAQSSLSRAVADVERRVGVSLFERTTRKVLPTPEGREFVRVASDVVASFDSGMNHLAGFLEGSRGIIRVATLPSLAATLLPAIVSAFRRDHPAVEIRIEDALLGEVTQRVGAGLVDFAVTVAGDHAAGLVFRPIATDRFCCVFPPGHAFGSSGELAWKRLHGEQFIAFDRTSSVRAHVDQALAQSGTTPATVTEARNIAAVAGLVAAGLGVSAVPGLVLPLLEFAHLEHRPLTDPDVTRTLGVLLDPRRPPSPAVRGFLRTIAAAQSSALDLPDGANWADSHLQP